MIVPVVRDAVSALERYTTELALVTPASAEVASCVFVSADVLGVGSGVAAGVLVVGVRAVVGVAVVWTAVDDEDCGRGTAGGASA